MGGVINYYHGESGVVVDRRYIVTDQQQAQVLRLRGNPHREFAYDYEGGDIHIDPLLKPGNKAVFVRTDSYGGVWVREEDQLYRELQKAVDRVIDEIRAKPKLPGSLTVRLHGAERATHSPSDRPQKLPSSSASVARTLCWHDRSLKI
jgi:hypothetical protein